MVMDQVNPNVRSGSNRVIRSRSKASFRPSTRRFRSTTPMNRHRHRPLARLKGAIVPASGYATQMPGTATVWNRCGEATADAG